MSQISRYKCRKQYVTVREYYNTYDDSPAATASCWIQGPTPAAPPGNGPPMEQTQQNHAEKSQNAEVPIQHYIVFLWGRYSRYDVMSAMLYTQR